MHSVNLASFLSGHVFAFVLLLSRLGGMIMLFPGLGEAYVPRRTRLVFALFLSFLLLEPLLPRLPPLPASGAEMTRLIGEETLIGLFFGTLIRLMLSALETAGMMIGLQTGLSNATMLNPAQATQSTLPSTFLGMAGILFFFVTGADHFLIRSLVGFYDLFPPGGAFLPADMAQTVMAEANHSFVAGVEIAAPFLIIGLLLYVAMGVLQRLLPSIQVFMLLIPVQIGGGILLLSLTFAGMLTAWLLFFDQSVADMFKR